MKYLIILLAVLYISCSNDSTDDLVGVGADDTLLVTRDSLDKKTIIPIEVDSVTLRKLDSLSNIDTIRYSFKRMAKNIITSTFRVAPSGDTIDFDIHFFDSNGVIVEKAKYNLTYNEGNDYFYGKEGVQEQTSDIWEYDHYQSVNKYHFKGDRRTAMEMRPAWSHNDFLEVTYYKDSDFLLTDSLVTWRYLASNNTSEGFIWAWQVTTIDYYEHDEFNRITKHTEKDNGQLGNGMPIGTDRFADEYFYENDNLIAVTFSVDDSLWYTIHQIYNSENYLISSLKIDAIGDTLNFAKEPEPYRCFYTADKLLYKKEYLSGYTYFYNYSHTDRSHLSLKFPYDFVDLE